MSQEDGFYQEALQKTDEVFSPGIGFGKEVTTSVIVRQNNTIIELLLGINRKLDFLIKQKAPSVSTELDDIIGKLKNLQVSSPEDKVAKKNKQLAVWRDPQQLVNNLKKK